MELLKNKANFMSTDLCLLLIVQGPWVLVKTITAFTVAHSITLGLATLGIVNVPPRPVDAAIALEPKEAAFRSLRGEILAGLRKPLKTLPNQYPGLNSLRTSVLCTSWRRNAFS